MIIKKTMITALITIFSYSAQAGFLFFGNSSNKAPDKPNYKVTYKESHKARRTQRKAADDSDAVSSKGSAKAADKPIYYGPRLCEQKEFECLKVASGDTWERLFPNEEQRDIVQRINRTYNNLWTGKVLAVPKNLAGSTLFDYSPFPLKIDDDKEKQIIVDQEKLAWAAYNQAGELVKWGPIASGSDKCSDNSSSTCRTMTGIFRVFSKENERCKSNVFPIGKGGAKMPFCMYFHKGIALHGSDDIPGYRASHGCVRMFIRDAKWLNLDFVETAKEQNNYMGTKVVVRPLIFVENRK